MNDRYAKLFSLDSNLYAKTSPVIIEAGALLKDNTSGKTIAQLKFVNISNKIIVAIKVRIDAQDVTGNRLEGIEEFQYLDLRVGFDEEFGQTKPIIMPDATTRSFSVKCTAVVFDDGSVWTLPSDAVYEPIPSSESLFNSFDEELVVQYKIDTTQFSMFVPTEYKDLWICSCGCANSNAVDECRFCRAQKEIVFGCLDKELLQSRREARLRELEMAREAQLELDRKAAEERAEHAAESKRRIKTVVKKVIPFVVAAIVLAILIEIASQLFGNGRLDDAIEVLNNSSEYAEEEVLEALSYAIMTGLEDRWELVDDNDDGMDNDTYKRLFSCEKHMLDIEGLQIDDSSIETAYNDYVDSVHTERIKQLLYNDFEYDDLKSAAYSRAIAILALNKEGVIDIPQKYRSVYEALTIEFEIVYDLAHGDFYIDDDNDGVINLSLDVQNTTSTDFSDFTITLVLNGETPIDRTFDLNAGDSKYVTFAIPEENVYDNALDVDVFVSFGSSLSKYENLYLY